MSGAVPSMEGVVLHMCCCDTALAFRASSGCSSLPPQVLTFTLPDHVHNDAS